MKKLLSLVLAVSMITAVCVSAFAAKFSDVTSAYSWAESAINELVDAEVITGYPDGTFGPGNSVTKQEAITLLSRSAGLNNSVNAWIVEEAANAYKTTLTPYDTYAKDAMAFLIYKGILAQSDIETYLNNSVYNKPLARYEAAMLLTKIMGGEKEVQNMVSVVPYYSDYAEIPTEAMRYVEYVREHGIMMGMDTKKFGPNSPITRAQIAVIIQRVLQATKPEYIGGIVESYDLSTKILKIKSESGSTNQITLTNDVVLRVDGTKIALSALSSGMRVVVTLNSGKPVQIDAQMVYSDETIEGVMVSTLTDNSGTSVNIKEVGAEDSKAKKYMVATDATIMKDGKALTTVSGIRSGDFVTATVKNNKITYLTAENKSAEVQGVIEEIVFDPDYKIKVMDSDNKTREFLVADTVTVNRNGKVATMRDLTVGDVVTVSLEYRRIVAVVATSRSRVVEGTLEEIIISSTPSIKLKSGSEILSLSVSRDIVFVSDDNSKADIYSLRLGQTVKVTLESNTVVKLEFKTPITKNTITGTVKVVNTSYGFIDLEVVDASTYETTIQKVFVKSNATIVNASTGNQTTLKAIKEGDRLTITGTTTLGVFEATVIVVEAA